MGQNMKENSIKMIYRVLELTFGQVFYLFLKFITFKMVGVILDSGERTKWKEKVQFNGLMAKFMRDNIKMTKSMVK